GDLNIAVIEAKSTDGQEHPGFDSRAIALSYATVSHLRQIKVWDWIKELATPIRDIHISDQSHLGMSQVHAQKELAASGDALGYVVALEDVGPVFHQALTQSQQIDFYCPNQLAAITRTQQFSQLTLDDGSVLQTQLVVAADGTYSKTCQQLGLELTVKDFQQSAVIANVATQLPVDGWAYERFTPSGPVAFLPMSKAGLAKDKSSQALHRYSVVWCLPSDEAIAQTQADTSNFLRDLQQAFGWRLGKMLHTGERFSYPLRLSYRERVISHRVVMIGNAAQTLHPIAGQGFNLGMRDVMSLAETLTQNQGQDLGSYAVLSQYQARRQPDRDATMALTSNLVTLFSNSHFPLEVGRNLGLLSLDYLSILKTPVIRRTLGLVER
ncbi:MAG: 2-octaprenyl-6-methoxyphenyl hydroxylase, partial [Vibrio sp.]